MATTAADQSADVLFVDTNVLVYANIVATVLTYGIPALLTHNGRGFERFADHIRVELIA